MKIPISPRLLACAAFVGAGECVADVGCDHGYLGLYLLQQGIADRVLAADVRRAPLDSAVRNAEKYGLRDKISFYLSDGVKNIPRTFDTLICAGMGADTMISILEAAPWLRADRYRLILQCQSKTPDLRRYLSERGWHIDAERVLRDGRFLYTVMSVRYRPECPPLTPAQCYFPPAMLENPGAETAQYYRRTCKRLRIAVSARADETSDRAIALKQLEALAEQPQLHFLKEEPV